MKAVRLLILLIMLTLANQARAQAPAQPRPTRLPKEEKEEAVQIRVALPTVVGAASDYVGALLSKEKRQELFKQKRSRTSNPVLILNVPTAPSRWLERNFGRDTP